MGGGLVLVQVQHWVQHQLSAGSIPAEITRVSAVFSAAVIVFDCFHLGGIGAAVQDLKKNSAPHPWPTFSLPLA